LCEKRIAFEFEFLCLQHYPVSILMLNILKKSFFSANYNNTNTTMSQQAQGAAYDPQVFLDSLKVGKLKFLKLAQQQYEAWQQYYAQGGGRAAQPQQSQQPGQEVFGQKYILI
jgi:hypothetical protein